MRKTPARHPDHDPRVALSDALLGRPRDPHRGRGGDRRRDSRRRPKQAGVHLALSLERSTLVRVSGEARRAAGSSAGPPRIRSSGSGSRRLSGRWSGSRSSSSGRSGSARIVDAGRQKELDLEIVVPVDDMSDPGAPNFPNADGVPAEGEPNAHVRSIWPAIYPELLRLVQEHTSTIIFVNARRAAERLAKRLNELANEEPERELPATEHAGTGEDPTEQQRGGSAEPSPSPRGDRAGSPRVPQSRGADGGRGDAEVGAAALPGRDVVAGAGDRYGGGRSGDPGRVAEVGQPRPAAGRARRPLARRGLPRPDLPQVPRRPARVRGRRQTDADAGRSRRP